MVRLFSVVSSILLASSAALAQTVTLNPGTYRSSVRSYAWGGSTTPKSILYPMVIPYSKDQLVQAGDSSSHAHYELSNSGFQITMDHARATMQYANAASEGGLFFTVDQNVEYVMEGVYTASDPDGRTVLQTAWLYDLTDNDFVFDARQESWATANESFTLGLQEGDYANTMSGSLIGTLLAGHSYELTYRTLLYAYTGASTSPATATGYFRMAFVPEPLVVDIDIKPGSDPNVINPFDAGEVAVAILGSDDFDVTDVDVSTLAFGPHGAMPVDEAGGHLEDVNGDGLMDLVSHYAVPDTGIAMGDVEECLVGNTLYGIPFKGCDAIATPPLCGLGWELVLIVPGVMWLERRRTVRRSSPDSPSVPGD